MANNIPLINPQSILHASPAEFDSIALQLFRYQYLGNDIYRQYCDALNVKPDEVSIVNKIPFLPISFFRTHTVITGDMRELPELYFESSGTTGETTSRHYVADRQVYEQSLLMGFRQFYGEPQDYAILALLPSYLERQHASLVYMAKTLMRVSGHPDNGFYINEWETLADRLSKLAATDTKVLLLGVTFALLDFAERYPGSLHNVIVMETGGMKGRRQELTRTEVHHILSGQWKLPAIHSEYGMTELLSQAYSMGHGRFQCTNTMRVFVRDVNDPLDVMAIGTGAINVIDLANIHSCSFIATEDIGRLYGNGSFEVLGRMDHSILRGCSLMAI